MVVETKDAAATDARTYEQFINGQWVERHNRRDLRAPQPGHGRAGRNDPLGRHRGCAQGDRRGALRV